MGAWLAGGWIAVQASCWGLVGVGALELSLLVGLVAVAGRLLGRRTRPVDLGAHLRAALGHAEGWLSALPRARARAQAQAHVGATSVEVLSEVAGVDRALLGALRRAGFLRLEHLLSEDPLRGCPALRASQLRAILRFIEVQLSEARQEVARHRAGVPLAFRARPEVDARFEAHRRALAHRVEALRADEAAGVGPPRTGGSGAGRLGAAAWGWGFAAVWGSVWVAGPLVAPGLLVPAWGPLCGVIAAAALWLTAMVAALGWGLGDLLPAGRPPDPARFGEQRLPALVARAAALLGIAAPRLRLIEGGPEVVLRGSRTVCLDAALVERLSDREAAALAALVVGRLAGGVGGVSAALRAGWLPARVVWGALSRVAGGAALRIRWRLVETHRGIFRRSRVGPSSVGWAALWVVSAGARGLAALPVLGAVGLERAATWVAEWGGLRAAESTGGLEGLRRQAARLREARGAAPFVIERWGSPGRLTGLEVRAPSRLDEARVLADPALGEVRTGAGGVLLRAVLASLAAATLSAGLAWVGVRAGPLIEAWRRPAPAHRVARYRVTQPRGCHLRARPTKDAASLRVVPRGTDCARRAAPTGRWRAVRCGDTDGFLHAICFKGEAAGR